MHMHAQLLPHKEQEVLDLVCLLRVMLLLLGSNETAPAKADGPQYDDENNASDCDELEV